MVIQLRDSLGPYSRAVNRSVATAALLYAALFSMSVAASETLYSVATRSYVSLQEVVGRLYVVDADTGGTKLIGPLRTADGTYVGANALAMHPKSGVMYGVTAGISPGLRPNLFTVNVKTSEVTLIGALGQAASDICFDSHGTLFAWLSELKRLGTVNLRTGAATPFGPESTIADATGGGLAIDGKGTAYIATTTAVGTLDTVDSKTGTRTVGPALTGAPYLSAIRSLTFSSSGILYGVNTNLALPAKSALVIIDPRSGVVSLVGALPDDANALAFLPGSAPLGKEPLPVAAYVAIAAALVVLAAVAVSVMLRRRREK